MVLIWNLWIATTWNLGSACSGIRWLILPSRVTQPYRQPRENRHVTRRTVEVSRKDLGKRARDFYNLGERSWITPKSLPTYGTWGENRGPGCHRHSDVFFSFWQERSAASRLSSGNPGVFPRWLRECVSAVFIEGRRYNVSGRASRYTERV